MYSLHQVWKKGFTDNSDYDAKGISGTPNQESEPQAPQISTLEVADIVLPPKTGAVLRRKS